MNHLNEVSGETNICIVTMNGWHAFTGIHILAQWVLVDSVSVVPSLIVEAVSHRKIENASQNNVTMSIVRKLLSLLAFGPRRNHAVIVSV